MKVYSIYKIANTVNKKVYIGFTSKQTPTYRWSQHKAIAAKGPEKNYCLIHRMMNQFGEDKFRFEVIYQSLDKDHTLGVMEQFFIDQYDSINKGYNMANGGGRGNLGRTLSEETKEKMRQAKLGKKRTTEHNENNRRANARWWKITFPCGKVETVQNLNTFCKEHGLSQGPMSQIARGIGRQHKGFKCEKLS